MRNRTIRKRRLPSFAKPYYSSPARVSARRSQHARAADGTLYRGTGDRVINSYYGRRRRLGRQRRHADYSARA
eukprot:2694410-Pyramimonas_sp.AAC.1